MYSCNVVCRHRPALPCNLCVRATVVSIGYKQSLGLWQLREVVLSEQELGGTIPAVDTVD